MRVCSKSSFVFIWFLFSLSIFLSILPSLPMGTSSFLLVSPAASHANQPYPHYTDFDSAETSATSSTSSAPNQPHKPIQPTTTHTAPQTNSNRPIPPNKSARSQQWETKNRPSDLNKACLAAKSSLIRTAQTDHEIQADAQDSQD